jgi:hypothetical protein
MALPFKHVDAPTLVGSWPINPLVSGGTPSFLPNTLLSQATILGVVKETSTGYDVISKSFFLDVDGTQLNMTFSGSGTLTLQEVIDQMNVISQAGISEDVAFRDNGFLRLTSPTAGDGSTIQVRTDPASSPTDVLFELGLFAETYVEAGDTAPAGSIDPDRQVALPGQLTWAHGENLEANAINRALFQLAINADRSYGILERKRMAETVRTTVVDPADGFTISDTVYTGPVTTPTAAQLEDVFTILDSDGNEIVQEDETVTHSSQSISFDLDADTGDMHASGPSIFASGDTAGDFYVRSNDAGMGALQNVRLKITSFVSATDVVIRNVNPATGARDDSIDGQAVTDGERIQLTTTHVRATGMYESPSKVGRIEQDETVKDSGAITRVEKNNRVVVVGATFETNEVVVGDIVDYTGHTGTDPYVNNGTYRVLTVVDEETLDLQSEDYEPVFLSPIGTLGSVSVHSDGDFYEDPFIELNTTLPSGTYTYIYKKQSSFKDITDTVDAVGAGLQKYQQEAEAATEAVLLRIIGPSIDSFDDYLYSDRRMNLEDIHFRLNDEHYAHDEAAPDGSFGAGRHRTIRPDDIDIFNDTGEAVTAVKYRQDTDNADFRIKSDGSIESTTASKGSWSFDNDGSYYYIYSADSTELLVEIGNTSDPNGDVHLFVNSIGSTADAKITLSSATSAYLDFEADSQVANPVQFRQWLNIANSSLEIDVLNDGTGSSLSEAAVSILPTDGSITIGKAQETYDSVTSILNVARPSAGWGPLIDGISSSGLADLLFKFEPASPTADQNIVQLKGLAGKFQILALDDIFNLEEIFMTMDLSSGLVEIGKSNQYDQGPAVYLEVNNGVMAGDWSGAAYPASDPGGLGFTAVGASTTGSMLVDDGGSIFGLYVNSYYDTTDTEYQYRALNTVAARITMDSNGDMWFSTAPASGAAGSAITWQDYMRVDETVGNVTFPRANVQITNAGSGLVVTSAEGGLGYVADDSTSSTMVFGYSQPGLDVLCIQGEAEEVAGSGGSPGDRDSSISVRFDDQGSSNFFTSATFGRRLTSSLTDFDPTTHTKNISAVGTGIDFPAYGTYPVAARNAAYVRNARNSVIALARVTYDASYQTSGGIWNIDTGTAIGHGSTGIYTLTLKVPIDTVNPIFATIENVGAAPTNPQFVTATIASSTTIEVRTYNNSGALADMDFSVVVFGLTSVDPVWPMDTVWDFTP